MTSTIDSTDALTAVPDGFDVRDVEQFLYREARYADESDYDSWEELWTPDALYWPASSLNVETRVTPTLLNAFQSTWTGRPMQSTSSSIASRKVVEIDSRLAKC